MIIKKITGTWFEFTHHNVPEGKYWNSACRLFSEEQWREKVREIKSLDMKYIVLMCTSLVYEEYAEAYFKTDIYPFAKNFACDNPIEALLDEADKQDIRVFVSAGFYGVWTHTYENMTSPEVTRRAFKAMEELYTLYGHHKSFYGWYFPDETCIDGHFMPEFIKYTNEYAAYGRHFGNDIKCLIAPYGTNVLKADSEYVRQLESIDADYIAYQDEIGVRKSTPEQTGAYYEALRKAHDKAGRAALWADMEIFEFEGAVYRTALIPASVERVKKQLEAISCYVDEVLCYQYLGMMNSPGTAAFCGHPDSVNYYNQYKAMIKEIR
ncbi:MAG: DUF4434 domain-containing protein [Eubacteriales bacterium]|nr:DUF4434 domain-containing protein [Eubacteriales bacterium]